MLRLVVGLMASLLLASPASAAWNEPHAEGAKPHPILKYYPEARVYDYSSKTFDSADVVTGYNKGADEPGVQETVEGRVTRYEYEHKPGVSTLEVVRQYEAALKKAGFVTIVAGKRIEGLTLGDNDAVGVFRLDKDGKPAVYVNVTASLSGDDAWSRVLIVEPQPMEEKYSVDADGLYDEIARTGRVAVYGINFETGKATLTPDSEVVLAEVQKLLTRRADLKIRIEGHTDNVGKAAANKKLSEDRAAAVRAWLVGKGVDAKRLTASGFGDSKPVAENDSDEGRARNRRVELVKS